jgi:hypothetical protein
MAPLTRAGSGAANSGSIRTLPVHHSTGPLREGPVPLRLICISIAALLADAVDAPVAALIAVSVQIAMLPVNAGMLRRVSITSFRSRALLCLR